MESNNKVTIFVGEIANLEDKAWFGNGAQRPRWIKHGVLVVENGRVLALEHTLADLDHRLFQNAELHRLSAGQLIIPAFHDAHNHPHAAGQMELQCNLRGLTLSSSLNRIEQYVMRNEHLDWIIGSGWDFDWPVHASLLDKIVPDRPAAFRRVDGHAMWVNSRAMKLTSVQTAEMDPAHVDLDEHGALTGVFHETAADHFRKFFGHLTMEERMAGFRIAQEEMAYFGICSFTDALVRPLFLQSYELMHGKRQLRMKATLCLYWDNSVGMEQIEHMIKARDRSAPGLRINSVKLMVDGVVESETASLHEPYCGCVGSHSPRPRTKSNKHKLTRSSSLNEVTGNYGVTNFDRDALIRIVELLDREKFQIHCHAVGDRAVTNCLDAFENARQVNGHRDARHQIAHLQVVRPEDVPRMKELDVYANFQPFWTMPDKGHAAAELLLGSERAKKQYPIKAMLEAGVKVVFGSDWNVSSLSPFDGIQACVTHQQLHSGPDDEVWSPEQCLTVEQALACYTLGSAHANFEEKESGGLFPGGAADFAILDQDIMAVPHHLIHRTKVLATYVNGELLHSGGAAPWRRKLHDHQNGHK